MENEEKLVKIFVKVWLSFYDDVNEKKGINEEKLNKLYFVMEDLEKLVAKKGAVPIDVASIFIDLYSSIESLAYIYGEEDRQEIFEVADNLASAARDIL